MKTTILKIEEIAESHKLDITVYFEQTLTGWHFAERPRVQGVYRRRHMLYRNSIGDTMFGYAFSYWDGRRWGSDATTPTLAFQVRQYASPWQFKVPWQGLSEPTH